jgi:tRNA-2-methylthio-N6-dimethylallyladenosine synthase
MSGVPPKGKTFYLETFGCQMNVHDSEKVVGTLLSEGYRQVQTVAEADLILYNTCSIRDKAEQKVFNRLNDYKKLQAKGKKFGVLGCVAQQEGEKIFERAPYVSLVCGSASYRKLPEMLTQLDVARAPSPTMIENPEQGTGHSESFDTASSRRAVLSPTAGEPALSKRATRGRRMGTSRAASPRAADSKFHDG